jgi:hypothetical protein
MGSMRRYVTAKELRGAAPPSASDAVMYERTRVPFASGTLWLDYEGSVGHWGLGWTLGARLDIGGTVHSDLLYGGRPARDKLVSDAADGWATKARRPWIPLATGEVVVVGCTGGPPVHLLPFFFFFFFTPLTLTRRYAPSIGGWEGEIERMMDRSLRFACSITM